ncbi:MAG: MarR family transcriptional regulator [Eubacterium ventriosum]
MDDKKKYYEEKAKELLNFNMMAKQSKMSDNLHKMARGEAIMLECLAHSDNGLMPNEIAKSAHVSTARVAAFLKAVEKKGYIQRISLGGDRRR